MSLIGSIVLISEVPLSIFTVFVYNLETDTYLTRSAPDLTVLIIILLRVSYPLAT